MRLSILAASLVVLTLLSTTPAPAVPVPVLAENVELVAQIPDATAVSGTFDPVRPYWYVSSRHGITVYDVTNPELPLPVGTVPFVAEQNEAVSMGGAYARPDGSTFVLFGLDLAGVAPTGKLSDTRNDASYVYVIDVTNPKAPFLRSSTDASTNTHTVSCIDAACNYAYTAGTRRDFSIIDLRDLDRPKELRKVPSPFGWHDWDVDDAGVAWQTGDGGTAAWDVTDPANPVLLNTTDKHGVVGGPGGYNDFIHHNSQRPFANAFNDSEGTSGPPSLADGNVLLVTEEDYTDPTCGGGEGSFSTWHVPTLDERGVSYGEGQGTVTPLDQWTTELLGTGGDNVAGALCSAHYFDVHEAGVTAHAWYQQGVRFLDVRNPSDVKQVGYWVPEASEVWASYFVPKRDAQGRVVVDPATGARQHTNLVYTTDAVRGIDVLRVTLPATAPAKTPAVVAPVLPAWFDTADEASHRRTEYGFVCLLPRERPLGR